MGWKNIVTEDFVGDSRGYGCTQAAIGTTNAAGGRNVQLLVLSSDGTVVHALPGFWHPEDLASELSFAKTLHALWRSDFVPRPLKRSLFRTLQLAEKNQHSKAMVARSAWQAFDRRNELERRQLEPRDTFTSTDEGEVLKGVEEVFHDRLAEKPYCPFDEFDVFAFADYGRPYYDNNRRVDRSGITFMTPSRLAKEQEIQARRKKAAEKKRAAYARRQESIRERKQRAAEHRREARVERRLRAAERRRAAFNQKTRRQAERQTRVAERRQRSDAQKLERRAERLQRAIERRFEARTKAWRKLADARTSTRGEPRAVWIRGRASE